MYMCCTIQVDKMACIYNIHLRTGCFCNPGACQRYLDLTSEQILENMEVHIILYMYIYMIEDMYTV